MLGAALGLVAPWNAVPGIFVVLAQTLAGSSMFVLGRRFFSAGPALFGAACYAANPYALLLVYMRSDFAEELACALLPLLLLAAVQLCGLLENHWRSGTRVTAIFALLFAGVWLCNAPAGVVASYSLTLLLVYAALAEKSLAPLWRGAGGLALGFALAGFYLFPAAYEQPWVNIGQALSSGLQPVQNFLYTATADPEHNAFNWIASSVAVLLVGMTAIVALLARRTTENPENEKVARRIWPVMVMLGAAATILMLRPSSILWELVPKLRFVQFPWRWTGILAVPYAYFAQATFTRRRAGGIWIGVVILAAAGTATFLVRKAWWDSDDIPALQDAIANGQGFDGTDEYDPAKDDHTDLPAKAPPVEILLAKGAQAPGPKAEIRTLRWTAEEKELSITSPQPLRIAIRLLDYPGWRVEVNGRSVKPQSPETTAQMILPLSPGTHHIQIKFVRTTDRILGGCVSLLSLLAAVLLLSKRRARQRTT